MQFVALLAAQGTRQLIFGRRAHLAGYGRGEKRVPRIGARRGERAGGTREATKTPSRTTARMPPIRFSISPPASRLTQAWRKREAAAEFPPRPPLPLADGRVLELCGDRRVPALRMTIQIRVRVLTRFKPAPPRREAFLCSEGLPAPGGQGAPADGWLKCRDTRPEGGNECQRASLSAPRSAAGAPISIGGPSRRLS